MARYPTLSQIETPKQLILWPKPNSGEMTRSTSRVNEDDREYIVDLLARCYDDFNIFNTEFLGRSPYWSSADSPEPQYAGQVEWTRAVHEYHTTCIETGNMLGKDYWIAGILAAWLATREDSLVIVMGPGQTTLCTITWKEVHRAITGSKLWQLVFPGTKISVGTKTSPAVVEIAPTWRALGYSTTNVERASGQHSPNLLVIVEEASGLQDHAWEAIDSLGAQKLVAIGNPLRAICGFARRCDQAAIDAAKGIPKSQAVCHFNVPSTAHPHADQEKSTWGGVCKTWLEGMARQWGKTSAWFLSHILARRPKIGGEELIPDIWLNYYYSLVKPTLPANHPVHLTRRIACDLGEGVGRDSSCVLVRDDWGVLEVRHGNQMGPEQAAHTINELAVKWNVPHKHISYDKLGVGKAMPNHLAKWGITEARAYAGSGAPMDRHSFTNIRAEAAWKARLRLDPEHIPNCVARPRDHQVPFYFAAGTYQEQLATQLKPLTYTCEGTGIKLLKKEDWKEILGASPDIADTFIQSFAFA